MRRRSSRWTRCIARASTAAILLCCGHATRPAIAAPKPEHEEIRQEGTRLAEAGDDEAALDAWRRAYGRVPEGAEGDADRAALMLAIGRAERRLYERNREPPYLRRAAAAFRYCVEHEAVMPEAEREAVTTELAEVERSLAEIDGTAAEPDPAAAPTVPVAVQPAAAPAPAPVPPPRPAAPPDPGLQRARKTASGVAVAGAVFAGAGGFAWLLLALPAEIAAQIAEDRAADSPVLVSESELQDRADNRRAFARTSFWVGLGCLGAGGIMLGVGLGTKARIERDMNRSRARVSLVPMVSPREAGGTLMLRF